MRKIGFAYLGLVSLGIVTFAFAATPATPDRSTWRTIPLIPFKDPWTLARQRFEDIDDFRYSYEFEQSFSYAAAKVTLTYDAAPPGKYFIGHIEASGLKPNFAYQLKLAGKPCYGKRGWGNAGDDRANEAIGGVARWWSDITQTNGFDNDFYVKYKRQITGRKETIYGYHFMGDFVTDATGKASLDFDGSKSYHITWQDKQSGDKDTPFGTFTIGSETAHYYAYGIAVPNHDVKLWYEWQKGRKHDVVLPKGDYNCRLLISEETFHALDSNPKGGHWPIVLGTEDWVNGKPDGDMGNDVRFRIG